MSRDEIVKMIERLPADATEADVIQALHLRLQVEKGAKDAAEGRVISHAELKAQLANRTPLGTDRPLPPGGPKWPCANIGQYSWELR